MSSFSASSSNYLYWLPAHPNFQEAIKALKATQGIQQQLEKLHQLVNYRLNFTQMLRLDRRLEQLTSQLGEDSLPLYQIKLAIVGSATVEHLIPAIRIAALQKGFLANIYTAPYGQYRQEILNPVSELYTFAPDVVLLAININDINLQLPLDASLEQVTAVVEEQVNEWGQLWNIITTQLRASIIQHTLVLPVEQVFGQYDNFVPAAPNNVITRLNASLKAKASSERVLLLDVDSLAAAVGKQSWCNHSLWYHSKQDISPVYAPLYGDRVARILASLWGKARKCLVLDLDNTLWGGVIGDDGLGGIELGQGTALGEAFQGFQSYVKALKERGIILAVCSKNEENNAWEPFDSHPGMILQRDDISCFVANWDNKGTNLQRIAQNLNIGLDSLVFFDDNPVERDIVRQFIPAVAVPEVPEDPAWYARCLSDAGYFEAVTFSTDDLNRTQQYIANAKRNALHKQTLSLDSFLASLQMEMSVGEVDEISLTRATQLINKSNQFNLTTRRYTEAQVKAMAEDSDTLCLQIRLQDRFGDNGLISVIIAKPALTTDDSPQKALHLDTWLMSCRVLGRQVEQEALNFLVMQAQQRGYQCLQGEYIATSKNKLVQDHYAQLGFSKVYENYKEDGKFHSFWRLPVLEFIPFQTFIQLKQS